MSSPVKFVYHNNYWDGPLSGVCEIDGRRFYFSCVHDYGDTPDCRIYKFFDLTEEEWKEETFWYNLFVENVGDHGTYDKDGKRQGTVKPQALHDNFYKHPDYDKRRAWKAEDKLAWGFFDRREMKARAVKFRDYFIEGDRITDIHEPHCDYYDVVKWRDDAQFFDFRTAPETGKKPGWAIDHDGEGDAMGARFCPMCGKKLPESFKALIEEINAKTQKR